jgi:hypothetical protein
MWQEFSISKLREAKWALFEKVKNFLKTHKQVYQRKTVNIFNLVKV